MKILADENIPFVAEAFGHLGEVFPVRGRRITASAVADADVLLVRSVTRVGPSLLEGSSVRFVGTATIGTDHVDLAYLKKRGIAFAAAPGSNAMSVSEYLTAALLILARRGGYRLAGKSVGIVGVGNVGSRVAVKAAALGMKVLLNDPPLARKTGNAKYLPIKKLLKADFLTIHAPLTMEGPDATYHMVNEEFVAGMKPGAVLINTARGAIAEGRALKRALDGDQLSEVVLDVWENEPNPDASLIERAAISTPHVAGYGLDGKVRGTEMIYKAACKFLKARPAWRMENDLPIAPYPELLLKARGRHDEDVIRDAVLTVCDVEADDASMRKILQLPDEDRGAYFDKLRREYPVRREFHNTHITLSGRRAGLVKKLRGLGFKVA
jgi:erythronate-4-phosphate dehydrogenase